MELEVSFIIKSTTQSQSLSVVQSAKKVAQISCILTFIGLLRYKVDFQSLQLDEYDDAEYDIDDY